MISWSIIFLTLPISLLPQRSNRNSMRLPVEETEKVERSSVGRSRELGTDAKSGKNVYAKLGKFGAYVQIGENPDDNGGEKPKFASLRPGQFIENVSLEDAMELFKMPREVGTFEDLPVVANIG